MTKEEAAYLAKILNAWCEGKEIQIKSDNEWLDLNYTRTPNFGGSPFDYRIKPEAKTILLSPEDFLDIKYIRSTKYPDFWRCITGIDKRYIYVGIDLEGIDYHSLMTSWEYYKYGEWHKCHKVAKK